VAKVEAHRNLRQHQVRDVSSSDSCGGLDECLGLIATSDAVNLRMPDSMATRTHLFWLSFSAPFLLPERVRMSGKYRRYLLALDRQDMP
jgi:hypothetical protein